MVRLVPPKHRISSQPLTTNCLFPIDKFSLLTLSRRPEFSSGSEPFIIIYDSARSLRFSSKVRDSLKFPHPHAGISSPYLSFLCTHNGRTGPVPAPRDPTDASYLKIVMICTSGPGVSRAHPSRFLAAVGRVDAEITVGGGRVTQRSNGSVSHEVTRSIPREHPSEGPLRAP